MDNLTDIVNTFSKASKKPYEFLSVQSELAEDIRTLIKQIYDYTKSREEQSNKTTLPKLIIHKFDEEQIWQELELQNGSVTNKIVESVSQLSAKKDKLNFPLQLKTNKTKVKETNSHGVVINQEKISEFENQELDHGSEDDEEIEENEDYEDSEDEGDLTDENFSDADTKTVHKKGKLKPSVVDDKFFKLSELELFLQNEEKSEDKPSKETIDLFYDANEGPADYKYSDFFENPDELEENGEETENYNDELNEDNDYEEIGGKDKEKNTAKTKTKVKHIEQMETEGEDDDVAEEDTSDNMHTDEGDNEDKNKKKVRFSLLGSDEEEYSDNESTGHTGGFKKPNSKSDKVKSSLEERQERLGRVIENLEEEALSEKPWQLKGEVTANARPQNSLLEEAVDFDLSVRPAPMMTEEVTLRLEDIITQRIKDKAWDDVERKVKPVDTPSEFKKKLALDQEKSKLSLAEVYEQEFIKQREAATADDTEKQETEPALHVEVRSMLNTLFNKLDALSNYHYTPRPVAPELKVVTNVPAINMEEVAPISVADSALLAPEEIKGKKRKGLLMSKEERTDTDKKRARRLKKTKQRQRQRERAKAERGISKLNPGLGNKYSKLKAVKEVLNASSNISKIEESKEKVVRSSTSFFNKLQDEVKSQIKSKTSSFAKKKDKRNITAKKLKL